MTIALCVMAFAFAFGLAVTLPAISLFNMWIDLRREPADLDFMEIDSAPGLGRGRF